MRAVALAQGDTSGALDVAARAVATQGLYFLERTKAVIASYIVGVLKGAIPPYYSYNREDPSLVTVQAVVPFLVKSVTDGDWMKIQGTMDTLESLALARLVPQYILWPTLAAPDELSALKAELSEYFQLDQAAGGQKNVVASFLGLDLADLKKYVLWAAGGAAFLIAGPFVFDLLRSLIPKKH